MEVDPAYGPGFWVPSTYGKFVNQDRNFAVRLRLWKEGWWKPWTPQIVLGANDALNNSWTEGSKIEMSSATANGFYSRYYLAVTKHLSMKEVGEWGLHLALAIEKASDELVTLAQTVDKGKPKRDRLTKAIARASDMAAKAETKEAKAHTAARKMATIMMQQIDNPANDFQTAALAACSNCLAYINQSLNAYGK
jgi:hypothetical protein